MSQELYCSGWPDMCNSRHEVQFHCTVQDIRILQSFVVV